MFYIICINIWFILCNFKLCELLNYGQFANIGGNQGKTVTPASHKINIDTDRRFPFAIAQFASPIFINARHPDAGGRQLDINPRKRIPKQIFIENNQLIFCLFVCSAGPQHVQERDIKENTKEDRRVVELEPVESVLEELRGWHHATDSPLHHQAR